MTGNHFIALVPNGLKDNAELKALLGKMKRTLGERDHESRFTPPDLWHITLTFLGRLSAEEAAVAARELKAWTPKVSSPLELKVAGVGAFPEPESARVLWLGVQNSLELKEIKEDLDAHLKKAGLNLPSDEAFVPHLTIARLRNLQSVSDLVKLGGRKNFGTYRIGDLILFQTVMQGNMAKYIVADRKSL